MPEPQTTRHRLRQEQRAEQVGATPDLREARVADLESRTKAELEEIAAKRGLAINGTGSGGAILKADLVRALS